MTRNVSQYITVDPEVCHGQPVFMGTRIMVYLVLELLEAGESVEEILRGYPSLTREHIKDALHFAAERIARERFVPLTPSHAVSG